MTHPVVRRIHELNPQVAFWSVRVVQSTSDELSVRQNILQPLRQGADEGAMIVVCDQGGYGYAATPDLSDAGLARAFEQATRWARTSAPFAAFDSRQVPHPTHQGEYESQVKQGWSSMTLGDRISILQKSSELLKADPRIVDWEASLWNTETHQLYANSVGAQIEQRFCFMVPNLSATANEGGNTQSRTLFGRGLCRQAGLELLGEIDMQTSAQRIAGETIELLLAESCPSGVMDLVLAPDQMMLQIHESIGHPLELDRILGDERNYAGTSFVTLDMFGQYQYGSKLLNISFDPKLENEFASFGYDDDGTEAKKVYLIQDGILKTPLGGATSQARAQTAGVANARASSWNRAPIDRMANLNLEPGDSSFDNIIGGVERGVYMKTNVSWSIDDSRNKFQFGCEWAQLIEKGKLTRVVRNPNYRGISATFWRNLKKVGDQSTFEVYGTPFCGKGEPNQCIRVGHASPTCLFADVDVFGAD